MKKLFIQLLILGSIVSCPYLSLAQKTKEAEIIKRVKQYEDAYNRGDVKAVTAIYALNGSHTYVNGITNNGRIEIEKGLEEMLNGPMKGTQIQITPEVIRFPVSDIAVEDASFIMKGLKMPDGTNIPPIQGFCVSVYQKQNNEWFAVKIQCMVPLTPPK
jgi:uncharacterized protein (TIGR02246 family)